VNRRALVVSLGLVVLLLATAGGAAAQSLTVNPTTVREGNDFATTFLGQPWDMNADPYPDFPTVLFNINRASFVRGGGIWDMDTTSGDPAIVIHAGSIAGTQQVLKLGDRVPIPAAAYRLLSFRMCAFGVPGPPQNQAQIFWFFDQAPHSSFGASSFFTVSEGCKVYVIDLTQIGVTIGAPWGGVVREFRIDPIGAPGVSLQLDWIRLTTVDTSNVVTIDPNGVSGTASINLFVNRTCDLNGAAQIGSQTGGAPFTWGSMLRGPVAQPFALPESFEPGGYQVIMTVNGAGPFCQGLTIRKAPLFTFFQPSFFSGPDYAAEARGNRWGMSEPGDVQQMFNIVSPAFVGGVFQGLNANGNPDPAYLLHVPAPINTARYKYATFKILNAGAQDIGLGSVHRLVWWFQGVTIDRVVTRDMIVYEGFQTYSLDLTKVFLQPFPSTVGPGWTGAPTAFRMDPHEFTAQRQFFVDHVLLTGDDRVNGGALFPIRYTAAGIGLTITFFRDPDRDPNNGNHVPLTMAGGGCPPDPTAPELNLFSGTTCQLWNTAGVPNGTYFIRANVSDGVNQLSAWYSDTPVVIETPPPQMSLEAPGAGSSLTQPFPISGWAVHPGGSGTGVAAVHVYAVPTTGGPATFLGQATYGVPRPDIGAIFGAQFTNSGFSLNATTLSPGMYRIDVYALSSLTGTFNQIRSALVTVNSSAFMSLDTPGNGASLTQPFLAGGWAIDGAGPSGSGVDTVHLYAVPAGGGASTFVGETVYGGARPDIAGIFGARFLNSGFGMTVNGLSPGAYQLLAFARSTATGTFNNVAAANIVILSGARMAIDVPAPGAIKQPFLFAGWAIDLSGPTGTGVNTVHVYAVPTAGGPAVFVGEATYGGARPDIGALFGARFTNSGFGRIVGGLAPGAYQLQAFARSTATGTFNNVASVPITVFTDPRLAIDAPGAGATVSSSTLLVSGWALDLGVSSGTGVDAVHVYAFPAGGGAPTFVGEATYGTSRPDLGPIFGAQYVSAGYVLSAPGVVSPGSYQLQVFARSAVTGAFIKVQVIPITVVP
jgi:hypothetical protein